MRVRVYTQLGVRATGGQKVALIPYSWSYRQLGATWYGCWEQDLGSLQEQQVIFTPEPPSSPSVTYHLRTETWYQPLSREQKHSHSKGIKDKDREQNWGHRAVSATNQ